MLLFKPQHVEPILSGHKTQTRRIWARPRCLVGSTHQCRTRMLDTKSTFARVIIESVHYQRLDAVTAKDALAEGYPTRSAFLQAFFRINPGSTLLTKVYRVVFRVTS